MILQDGDTTTTATASGSEGGYNARSRFIEFPAVCTEKWHHPLTTGGEHVAVGLGVVHDRRCTGGKPDGMSCTECGLTGFDPKGSQVMLLGVLHMAEKSITSACSRFHRSSSRPENNKRVAPSCRVHPTHPSTTAIGIEENRERRV